MLRFNEQTYRERFMLLNDGGHKSFFIYSTFHANVCGRYMSGRYFYTHVIILLI